MKPDFAVLKSNDNFSATFTTSSGTITMSYGDFNVETSNVPNHTYVDGPPYLLNVKDIDNSTITDIAISGQLTALDVSRYTNLTSIDITDNSLNARNISRLLKGLDELGTSNGTFNATGNDVYSELTSDGTIAFNNLVAKSWTLNGFWTPSDITTSGWYDATDTDTITLNGSNVTQWDDKSGNGYDLVQTNGSKRPFYTGDINGLSAVQHFQGDYTEVLGISGQDHSNGFTAIGVQRWDNGNFPNMWQIRDDAADDIMSMRGESSGNRIKPVMGVDGPNSQTTGINTLKSIDFIGSIVYDNTQRQLTANGVVEVTNAGPVGGEVNLNQIRIGYSTNSNLDSSVGELILYGGSDVATIQKLEGYLAWKWGLTSKLPIAHPYKSVAP